MNIRAHISRNLDLILRFPNSRGCDGGGDVASTVRSPRLALFFMSLAFVFSVLSESLFTVATASETDEAGDQTRSREGRTFHAVYVVSADDLSVGAKVAVEPVLLTDKEEIIPFYDYCRALQGVGIQGAAESVQTTNAQWKYIKQVVQARGANDVIALRPFCRNESFMLPADHYFLLDNLGQRIRIGALQFRKDDQAQGKARMVQNLPRMTLSGTATIQALDYLARDIFPIDPVALMGKRFFLMSADESTLRAILPVRVPSQKEVGDLIARATELARKNHGMTMCCCSGQEENCYARWRKEPRPLAAKKLMESFTSASVALGFPVFLDMDDDGAMDIAVRMQSGHPVMDKTHGRIWTALGLVFGSGAGAVEGQLTALAHQEDAWTKAFSFLSPVASMKVGGRSFLLAERSSPYESLFGFGLIALPREREHHRDILLWKIAPMT